MSNRAVVSIDARSEPHDSRGAWRVPIDIATPVLIPSPHLQSTTYRTIIDDVIANVRQDFEDVGIEKEVLEELQRVRRMGGADRMRVR